MPLPSRKSLLVGLLVVAWLTAMASAFWWYQARYIRPFADTTALFSGDPLRLPAELDRQLETGAARARDFAAPVLDGAYRALGLR